MLVPNLLDETFQTNFVIIWEMLMHFKKTERAYLHVAHQPPLPNYSVQHKF